MSTTGDVTALSLPLVINRVRAYFAPVNRVLKAPTIFDPAVNGSFILDAPPSPWIDLGWIDMFARQSASKTIPLTAGSPATALYQVRESTDASVSFRFKTWSKLSMALAAGSQHMNVLAPGTGGVAIGSGAKALGAVALAGGSTANTIILSAPTALVSGAIVVIDADYTEQTGFVGTGVSAAYVSAAAAVGNDPDYVRRVSFNVSRVVSVSGTTLELAEPLIAGIPAIGMKLQEVLGFVDREGGSFFQEWSALFVMDGAQGDRVIFHYPRLQAMESASEEQTPLATPIEMVELNAAFRALPFTDLNDSEQVLCYRTYMPASMTLV